MNTRKNSSVLETVTSPSGAMSPGVSWRYASGAFICGALQKLRMLRRLCWATAVPSAPGARARA